MQPFPTPSDAIHKIWSRLPSPGYQQLRSKMNELAWRQHFPIISLWEIFRRSRAANSVVRCPIWPKCQLIRDFMHVLVTCKYKKDQIKNNRHLFPHYKSMGAFCCHGNQSFDRVCSKTLCSLSSTQWLIKIGQLEIFEFESVDDDDGRRRRTDDGPLVYYKLTLWAFGSGELKIEDLTGHGNAFSIFSKADFPFYN